MSYTILHAEDDEGVSVLIKNVAESAQKSAGRSIEVISAQDGLEAIALFEQSRTQNTPVNLVITDFNMPRANGGNVITAVRAHGKPPIIFYCSEAEIRAKQYHTEYAEKGTGIIELRGMIIKYASKKPRILYVEDNADMLDTIGELLNETGYAPVLAPNAEEGLKHITSVHAVVSDVNQPHSMGGYGLLAETRKRYSAEQLPFFLVSGNKIDTDICATHGAHPIKKPFEFDTLQALIRNALPEHLKPKQNP